MFTEKEIKKLNIDWQIFQYGEFENSAKRRQAL